MTKNTLLLLTLLFSCFYLFLFSLFFRFHFGLFISICISFHFPSSSFSFRPDSTPQYTHITPLILPKSPSVCPSQPRISHLISSHHITFHLIDPPRIMNLNINNQQSTINNQLTSHASIYLIPLVSFLLLSEYIHIFTVYSYITCELHTVH